MARNSEFFLGDSFIDVIKLGDDDIKIYLQDTLIYQPRMSISTATVTCNAGTYNGNPQSATTIQVTIGGNQLTLNEDFIVTSNTGGTNVGSYNVTVQGIGLYKGNASGTFTINKVTPTVVVPVPNVLTYNGTAQELITSGSVDFGTLKYKVGSSGSYSTSIPTRTRGGAYTVYYKVDGDSNINDVPENSVACSINEKPVTAVVTVSPSSYTYSGSYCEPTVTVKDGETVIDPSEYTVTYSNNLNAGTATVTIYDVVGGDYYVTGSTTFEIAKQTPVLATSPTSTSPIYNGSAQNLLTGGSMKHSSSVSTAVPGSFTYDQGTNADSYSNPKWYFTPTNTTNYNSTSGTVATTTTISCSSNYTITAPTAKAGLVYNGSSQTLYNAGSSATVSGSFGYTGGTMTNAGSRTVSWAFTPSSANYCAKNGSFTGSIAQKAISIPTPTGVSRAYNGNAATATFGSATGAGITKYRYSTNGSSWTESTTNPSQTNAGTLYTQAYYKANDANYSGEGWSNSATISISKANQSAPTATGATKTYPTTATATASGGGGQGSLEWSNGNTQTSVGSKTTKARWAGNSNYNASPYSNEVTLTMNKAAGSVTTAPVNTNYTYNGTARAVASAGSGTGTMYYRLGSSGSFSTTMPTMTNAGSNTLYYYAAASTNYEQSATGSITVSVQKANISPTVSISNWTYGNSASNPSVVGNSGGGTVTYYYKSTSSSSWSTTKPSNAGNYNIRADIAATTNYNSGTCTNSFTINKANPTYTAPTAKSLTYNGSAQSLLNAGSTNHGTIQYSSDGSNWGTTIPSQTNPNTYTTYWKLVGDANHNDVSSTSISTTIAKASQSAPTATGATTTYNTTATATASGGGGQGSLEWESTQSQTSVGSHSTRARWSGNSNYNASPWSNSVTVQMNKANQSAPTATGATTTYNTTATATASGGGGQGSLEWSNGSTRTAIGSQTTKARWSGNDNYNASSWSNEVTLRVYAPHAYVEIGGLKWATMNIGANSITDYGLYFQWGDTQGYTASQVGSGEGQKYFDWADYKYGNGQSWPGATGMTKYNETDGRTVLEASDDAAKAAWGGNWRMPTASEFIALGEAVTSAWTADYQGSGVAGMICTDKTDSSKTLFFPAAGSCYEGRLTRVDDGGSYWSSSLYAKDRQNAFGFGFNGSVAYWGGNGGRRGGFAVRPVVG